MTPETKEALAAKAWAVEFMKEQVFRGDFENAVPKQDASGACHFRDAKIQISCRPSGRDGWLNCSVTVSLIRRRWPVRKLEPVLVAGFGVDVSLFRPGQWLDYLSSLASQARGLQQERDAAARRAAEEDESAKHDANFGAVDDSSIFKK